MIRTLKYRTKVLTVVAAAVLGAILGVIFMVPYWMIRGRVSIDDLYEWTERRCEELKEAYQNGA